MHFNHLWQPHIEIHLLEPIRRGVAVVEAKAFVGETLACEAVLMAQRWPLRWTLPPAASSARERCAAFRSGFDNVSPSAKPSPPF